MNDVMTSMGVWNGWSDTTGTPEWINSSPPMGSGCVSCWPCHPPVYWYPMYADDLLRNEIAALRLEVAELRRALQARRFEPTP